MSKYRNNRQSQRLLLGAAALTAGIVGTITSLLKPQKKHSIWNDSAAEIANQIRRSKDQLNSNLILGGLAGGLVAVATALLFAPKSGKDLLEDLTHPFSSEDESSHDKSEKNSHKEKVKKKRELKENANGEDKVESHSKNYLKTKNRTRLKGDTGHFPKKSKRISTKSHHPKSEIKKVEEIETVPDETFAKGE